MLPSKPTWLDGLPRILPVPGDEALEGMQFAVAVPGGQIVAGFRDEILAKEFAIQVGAKYAARADELFIDQDRERFDANVRQRHGLLREA